MCWSTVASRRERRHPRRLQDVPTGRERWSSENVDATRDEGLGAVVERGGLYCVLGDARVDERRLYGITPGELRRRFAAAGGWEQVFAYETVFERRWGTSPAYFVGFRRR